MTLAALIRKYFEQRRRTCEEKARSSDWLNNGQYYIDHDLDDDTLNICNVQNFSNTLDPNRPNNRSRAGGSPNRKTYQQSYVRNTVQIKTLPDGTIQSETTVTDSNGNEERHISQHKNGKKYTKIIRKNASGQEEVEEKVTDANDQDIIPFGSILGQPSWSQKPRFENDYNFWFNKFFRSGANGSPDLPNDISSLSPNPTMDEILEKIIKGVVDEGHVFPPDSFTGSSLGGPKSSNSNIFPDFPSFFDDADERQRVVENFSEQLRKHGSKTHKKMGKIFKSLAPPKPPTMFERFAEDALPEMGLEETPFDKFVELDEDTVNKKKSVLQKYNEMIDKLNKHFDGNQEDTNFNNGVYSDIEDPEKVLRSPSMMPDKQNPFSSPLNPFGDLFRGTIEPRNFAVGKSVQTQMYIENGKKRIVSVSKDNEGNTIKDITYEMGNRSYQVKIFTDPSGRVIKKDRTMNFPENQLPDFKNHWGAVFHSDFNDD